MDRQPRSDSHEQLAASIVGVWWLLSRNDVAVDGSPRREPSLGSDPLGMLTYTPDRFAAQFMKRDRSEVTAADSVGPGQNNTAAVGGYDAYFGSYTVDTVSGDVIHRLEAALTPANVGVEVARTLTVEGDQLVIQLDTTTGDGEPIIRTLTWKRIG